MLKPRNYYFIILVIVFAGLPVSSCSPKYKAAKAQREHDKRMELRRKEGEKALLKGKERHIQVQSKEARQRMKQTQRQSQRLNNNRNVPFYKRWYRSIIKR